VTLIIGFVSKWQKGRKTTNTKNSRPKKAQNSTKEITRRKENIRSTPSKKKRMRTLLKRSHKMISTTTKTARTKRKNSRQRKRVQPRKALNSPKKRILTSKPMLNFKMRTTDRKARQKLVERKKRLK
jgi:hypothetical protein